MYPRNPMGHDPETIKAQAEAMEAALKWVGRKLRALFGSSAAGGDDAPEQTAPDAGDVSPGSGSIKGVVPAPAGEPQKPQA